MAHHRNLQIKDVEIRESANTRTLKVKKQNSESLKVWPSLCTIKYKISTVESPGVCAVVYIQYDLGSRIPLGYYVTEHYTALYRHQNPQCMPKTLCIQNNRAQNPLEDLHNKHTQNVMHSSDMSTVCYIVRVSSCGL